MSLCIYKLLEIHGEPHGNEEKPVQLATRRRMHFQENLLDQLPGCKVRLPRSKKNLNAREVASESEKWLSTVNLNDQTSAAWHEA